MVLRRLRFGEHKKAVQLLVGYGGCRMRSKYRLTISPREDLTGECGSMSFQGGPRGNMDARITPFVSHGVPLGSPSGPQKANSLQVYSVLLLHRTQPTQHRVCTEPLSYGGRGGEGHFYFSCIVYFCFRRRSRRRTNSAPRPLSYRGRGQKAI